MARQTGYLVSAYRLATGRCCCRLSEKACGSDSLSQIRPACHSCSSTLHPGAVYAGRHWHSMDWRAVCDRGRSGGRSTVPVAMDNPVLPGDAERGSQLCIADRATTAVCSVPGAVLAMLQTSIITVAMADRVWTVVAVYLLLSLVGIRMASKAEPRTA